MIVSVVPKEHLSQLWLQVSGYIDDALQFSDGDYTLEQAKVYLSQGLWQLLVVHQDNKIHGAIAVMYQNYPNDRIAFIVAIGGKWISDKESYKNFCEVLKNNGATKIQGAARESVARLWKRLGFRNKYIIVENSL